MAQIWWLRWSGLAAWRPRQHDCTSPPFSWPVSGGCGISVTRIRARRRIRTKSQAGEACFVGLVSISMSNRVTECFHDMVEGSPLVVFGLKEWCLPFLWKGTLSSTKRRNQKMRSELRKDTTLVMSSLRIGCGKEETVGRY
ncbi:hypothetical protein EJB05_26298 [Eragrostis curvula]|uniref:Uncharacterized protein n=1 Tax=Eragrostis curvula TaxID=38414 RepID=A0A5J9UL71_9POAL|nr:hypothetical protein EJB05_26298 [Eragrostis curvula]